YEGEGDGPDNLQGFNIWNDLTWSEKSPNRQNDKLRNHDDSDSCVNGSAPWIPFTSPVNERKHNQSCKQDCYSAQSIIYARALERCKLQNLIHPQKIPFGLWDIVRCRLRAELHWEVDWEKSRHYEDHCDEYAAKHREVKVNGWKPWNLL